MSYPDVDAEDHPKETFHLNMIATRGCDWRVQCPSCDYWGDWQASQIWDCGRDFVKRCQACGAGVFAADVQAGVHYIKSKSKVRKKKGDTMNYSRAIFLISNEVRLISCSYDKPDADRPEKPLKLYDFKSLDASINVGDYVVVPTDTRWGMTVVRVEEVDKECDVEEDIQLKWIIGKFDDSDYTSVLAQEQAALTRIRSAEKRRKREELKETLLKDMKPSEVKQLTVKSGSS